MNKYEQLEVLRKKTENSSSKEEIQTNFSEFVDYYLQHFDNSEEDLNFVCKEWKALMMVYNMQFKNTIMQSNDYKRLFDHNNAAVRVHYINNQFYK